MDKDKKKDDRVTVRLPEDLRKYEAHGFQSMTDFVKTALEDYIIRNDVEVTKANEIMSGISGLIQIMEAERDHNFPNDDYPTEKVDMISALYEAAKSISNCDLMVKHPANWMDYPEEMKEGPEDEGKHYKHTWAR